MKRKRGDTIGYQKDELLLETTSLNLMFNRVFNIEHNIYIFEYAKGREVEDIYNINQMVRHSIENNKYIGMDDIYKACAHQEI